MRVMIDGLGFEIGARPVEILLESVIHNLVLSDSFDCFVLDRGCAAIVDGASYIPFPSYHFRYTADDSILIQNMCDHYKIDLFISTFHTSPLAVPAICITYDTFPDKISVAHRARMHMERDLCLSYSRLLMIWPIVDRSYTQFKFLSSMDESNAIALKQEPAAAAVQICNAITASASQIVIDSKLSTMLEFYSKWSILRRIQSTVDTERIL